MYFVIFQASVLRGANGQAQGVSMDSSKILAREAESRGFAFVVAVSPLFMIEGDQSAQRPKQLALRF